MDRNLAGIIGALTALAAHGATAEAATSAPASVEEAMSFSSYADLLRPIPNALAVKQAADRLGAIAEAGQGEPEVMSIQYYRHHHHHHHRYYRPRYHHHHHHHHHHHRGLGIFIR